MVRKDAGAGRGDLVGRKREAPLVTLRDDELITVAGGATLTGAFTSAVKAIGEGLSAVARKG